MLAGRPLRPGVALETTSRFADPVWELGPAILQKHARDIRLDFSTVPTRYRGTAKELFHSMLSGPLPPDEPRLAISTVHAALARVARFLTWLDSCQLTGRSTPFAIREITATELTAYQRHVRLTAASGMVRARPPRLGALLRDLASRPPTPLMIPHSPNTPRWLFPGRVPGQPIDGHSLTNLLNRHGISARPAGNGALAALAADLPAAILADLLGLHVNTAVRWVTYARRDWTDYLALRAAEHSKPQRDA